MAEKTKSKPQIQAQIIKAQEKPITKSNGSTLIATERTASSIWLTPKIDQAGLKTMVEHSTILPQCIRAYKDNIAGFGIGIRYREDIEETQQMKVEWNNASQIMDLLNTDMNTKEVFEDIIESRETYGIAYLEVIRDLSGNVAQIEFIRDTPTIRKSINLEPAIETTYFYKGEPVIRQKKFCKYKQDKNGKTVFFKEFGDPRIMDIRTGEYITDNEVPEIQNQANEILEFVIGTEDYGLVRWVGQMLGIDGARKAENLNNNYFENGRHTPLAVIVSGGTLSEESFTRLQQYMNDIKGESGQHAFLLLEVEDGEEKAGFEEDKKPTVELKDMASILQKDELFQEYIDNSRRKAQSAFRLPDLYTGYTTDFNRATAQTAQEITEKQVFAPERESLAWILNNKLMNGYGFKYIEFYFKKPDITNPDDISRILTISERAGGVTPNMAKRITYSTMGWTEQEDYTEEWGDIPVAVMVKQITPLQQQLETQIQKASNSNDENVVCIMKEVRRLLLKMKEVEENA